MKYAHNIQPKSKNNVRCIAREPNKTGPKTWFWSKNQTRHWPKNGLKIARIYAILD